MRGLHGLVVVEGQLRGPRLLRIASMVNLVVLSMGREVVDFQEGR